MLVSKTFVPPEAHHIAAEFRQAASVLRQSSASLGSIGNTLEDTWMGHSKDLFFELFNGKPAQVRSLADWLDSQASVIENIHVTITVNE